MRFLLACWCLNYVLTTLHRPLICNATVFEKRKPKVKFSYENDDTSQFFDYRSPIPLITQRNIITKILYDLKRGHKSDHSVELTENSNDIREDSALLPDFNSFITERSVKYKRLPDDSESDTGTHARRRDYISNLPKPKKEMIDSILNNAVSQIFDKVIPGAQSKSNDTFTIAEVGAVASKNTIPVAKDNIPAADTSVMISPLESNATEKSKITSYAKRKDVNKKDVVETQGELNPDDSNVINDTLLQQIDAVTLTTGDENVKMEKDVVNNFERPIDQPEEPTSTVNDVGRSWMPRYEEVTTPHDTSHDMGSQFENDDEPPATNKGNRRSEYYYDPNAKDVGLTNEVDDEENFTPSLRDVQRHAEKHNLNLFQGSSTIRSHKAYRKHSVSSSEEPRNEDEKNLGEDYGTLFVKYTRGVKQLNFYNSDLHLAVTVNSSESRLNAMKAVATVLKELGGLTFEDEDEGVVSKAQFDKLMVDADEEDEPTTRSGEKAKRPNSPLNERQVKIAKFKDYTAPYIAHPIQGYDPHNPYTPHHLRPHLLRPGQEEPRGEEGAEGEEDAINYYQKNRPRDGERPLDGEERESLIPVGPVTEINTKGKVAAIREGDLVTLKGIRKADRTASVVGNTREGIGSSTDLTTDETPIPAVIHVDYNQLDNPRTFEKIFTDRVLLAPVVDKSIDRGPESRIKKGNVSTSVQLQGEVNAKKRHLPIQRTQEKVALPPRVVEHLSRTRDVGKGILVTTDDVAKSRDDKEKFYFHKLSVNNIATGNNENVETVQVTR